MRPRVVMAILSALATGTALALWLSPAMVTRTVCGVLPLARACPSPILLDTSDVDTATAARVVAPLTPNPGYAAHRFDQPELSIPVDQTVDLTVTFESGPVVLRG